MLAREILPPRDKFVFLVSPGRMQPDDDAVAEPGVVIVRHVGDALRLRFGDLDLHDAGRRLLPLRGRRLVVGRGQFAGDRSGKRRERRFELQSFVAAADFELRLLLGSHRSKLLEQLIERLDRFAVPSRDPVARLEAGLRPGTVGIDISQCHARLAPPAAGEGAQETDSHRV